ncbi:hypothetical protein Droror1_Dr00021962 [Drosera rotundifolia]
MREALQIPSTQTVIEENLFARFNKICPLLLDKIENSFESLVRLLEKTNPKRIILNPSCYRLRLVARISILDIDSPHHENCIDKPTGLVRVYRYPPCSVVDVEVKGIEENAEYTSVLSILMQNEIGGLKFLEEGNEFQ